MWVSWTIQERVQGEVIRPFPRGRALKQRRGELLRKLVGLLVLHINSGLVFLGISLELVDVGHHVDLGEVLIDALYRHPSF